MNFQILILSFISMFLIGCASAPKQINDYSDFAKVNPKSILVIPPLNNSNDVNAPYIFLSTISKALAEKGYYVFPVAVIDNYFKQNGLPTTAEMNAIKIDKLVEHLNPDAIMYVKINQWGQKFEVVQSRAVVSVDLELKEVSTGGTIWANSAFAQRAIGSYDPDSIWDLILGAVIGQVVSNPDSNTRMLSHQANNRAIWSGSSALPNGPYFPIEIQ